MIRNVVLHLNNEQPMLADLFEAPEAHDVGLRCTNLRLMNGKRPVFIDDVSSIFFFPYLHIRFIEIPPGALTGNDPSMAITTETRDDPSLMEPEFEGELEIDEDFLRRIREV